MYLQMVPMRPNLYDQCHYFLCLYQVEEFERDKVNVFATKNEATEAFKRLSEVAGLIEEITEDKCSPQT